MRWLSLLFTRRASLNRIINRALPIFTLPIFKPTPVLAQNQFDPSVIQNQNDIKESDNQIQDDETCKANFKSEDDMGGEWRCSGDSNAALINNLFQSGIIKSERIKNAMAAVDRAHYVPDEYQSEAYEDHPIPIGHAATISAPHMHAHALSLLEDHCKPGMKVLDVGCGSGVLCSMFARMVTENGADGKVVGIDYIKALVDMSDTNIKKGAEKAFLDSGVITLHQGDGWKGVPESAPYDAIHVGAAAATMPQDLVDQLAPGGRMVIPVGTHDQVFKRVDKDATGKVTVTDMMGVRYVPLVKDPEQY